MMMSTKGYTIIPYAFVAVTHLPLKLLHEDLLHMLCCPLLVHIGYFEAPLQILQLVG